MYQRVIEFTDYNYELQDNIASAGLPAIAALDSHPFKQPFGNDGSLLGSRGDSPKLHWHSCVAKLGLTVSSKPNSSLKNCCAGSLHWWRHNPLHPDS
jgi:hypothetical protein